MYQDELKKSSERIKFYMNNHGLTIQQLADLCNCTRVTISRVINEKYPLSDRLAHDMGRIFSVSPDYLKGTVDDPGTNSFVGSEEWHDRNAQNFYITKVLRYLEDLNYTITEFVNINDLKFKAQSLYTFSIYTTQQKLCEYGFSLGDTINIDAHSGINSYIDYECNIDDLIEKIKTLKDAHIEHYWEIEYESNITKVNETQFINIMYSFALLTQNYFGAALPNLTKISTNLSDIERAINQHAEEIAQGTWQAPSKEEDEQRLLQAIYGEKIPENQKKEE